MSSKKVYGISTGKYSDYSVLCICPSKKEAKKLVNTLNSDPESSHHDCRIEEFVVCDSAVKKNNNILTLSVELMDDGTERRSTSNALTKYPFDWNGDPGPCRWRWVRAPMYHNKGGRLEVYGTNHTRIRKVFTEKRAMIKADKSISMQTEIEGACNRV